MMTIFYMKSNGSIKVCLTGDYNMSFFGDEAADYELIYGFIIIPEDDFIVRNLLEHKVIDGSVVFVRGE